MSETLSLDDKITIIDFHIVIVNDIILVLEGNTTAVYLCTLQCSFHEHLIVGFVNGFSFNSIKRIPTSI